MWVLWRISDSNEFYYLTPKKSIIIGRRQGDIVLKDDVSISRLHAEIIVTLKEEVNISDYSTVSDCIIRDEKSKYGTIVIRGGEENNFKVNPEGIKLAPNDTIKFGMTDKIFKVEYHSFITTVSRLSSEHTDILMKIIDEIGGLVIDMFDNKCTHITATTALSTTKVIYALVAGIPIVNINYWKTVKEAIDGQKALPDPSDYTLALSDLPNDLNVSLKPNKLRKTLFRDKTFVFFSEPQYLEKKRIIREAGGKSLLIGSAPMVDIADLCKNNYIIIQVAINDDTVISHMSTYGDLMDKMQEKGLRPIPEAEIPLAIIYASMERHCNPKYNYKSLLARKNRQKDNSEILVPDTQDLMSEMNIPKAKNNCNFKNNYIPETMPYTEDNNDMHVVDNTSSSSEDMQIDEKSSRYELGKKDKDFDLHESSNSNLITKFKKNINLQDRKRKNQFENDENPKKIGKWVSEDFQQRSKTHLQNELKGRYEKKTEDSRKDFKYNYPSIPSTSKATFSDLYENKPSTLKSTPLIQKDMPLEKNRQKSIGNDKNKEFQSSDWLDSKFPKRHTNLASLQKKEKLNTSLKKELSMDEQLKMFGFNVEPIDACTSLEEFEKLYPDEVPAEIETQGLDMQRKKKKKRRYEDFDSDTDEEKLLVTYMKKKPPEPNNQTSVLKKDQDSDEENRMNVKPRETNNEIVKLNDNTDESLKNASTSKLISFPKSGCDEIEEIYSDDTLGKSTKKIDEKVRTNRKRKADDAFNNKSSLKKLSVPEKTKPKKSFMISTKKRDETVTEDNNLKSKEDANNYKAFSKAKNQIPVKRISMNNMKVWGSE